MKGETNASLKVRDYRIEWLKFAAICAIVFQHAVHSGVLSFLVSASHAAVPLMTFISTFYAAKGGRSPRSLKDAVLKRVVSLYGLFLFWNLIYFVLRFAAARKTTLISGFSGFSAEEFFLSGYANALWYLPFILVCNVFAMSAGRAFEDVRRRDSAKGFTAALTAGGLGGVYAAGVIFFQDVYFFEISRKGIAAALAGTLAGLVYGDLSDIRARSAVKLAVCLIFAGSMVGIHFWGRHFFAMETAAGISLVFVCLWFLDRDKFRKLDPNVSLLIFVAHPLVLHGMRKALLLAGLHWEKLDWTWQVPGYLALTSVLLALYAVLSKSGALRFFLPGHVSFSKNTVKTL